MKEISLYIHIPFCKQRCFYCDFPTFAGKERFREEYIEALVKEIEEKCSNYLIKTIFIGGGTPSYLEERELKKLLITVIYIPPLKLLFRSIKNSNQIDCYIQFSVMKVMRKSQLLRFHIKYTDLKSMP